MTQEEIIAMAQECNLIGMRPHLDGIYSESLVAFADLVAAKALAQRTWVGLTDDEVRDLWSWSATSEAEKTANTQQHAFARAIEAKLKEKNT